MPRVYSKAIDESIEVSRIIGEIEGDEPGPCLVFIGGVHGNEPSGVFALNQVIQEIKEKQIPIKGSIHALSGNLWALERGERFHKQDLNRLWEPIRIEQLENDTFSPTTEDEQQQLELFTYIQNLIKTRKGPFYFFDLHTTSSATTPFLTVNDSLLNRSFTEQYPSPIILGIEEYLQGPILSYINELGYVSFGFESGQHDDIKSIENHVSFTYLSLIFCGFLQKKDVDFDLHQKRLSVLGQSIYEIYYRYEIGASEEFTMEPGFSNFQSISKNQLLAKSNDEPVKSRSNSTIFMPLYQAQGEDGFFKIRKIHPFFLWLSGVFRKWRVDKILPILPGIRWSSEAKDTLIVNLKIARVLTKQFLHLLGYRSKKVDRTHLIIKNRESAAKNKEYENEVWFK